MSLGALITGSAVSGVFFLLAALFFRRLTLPFHLVPGFLLSLALFFCGASWTLLNKADLRPDFFYKHLGPGGIITVRVTEPLQEKAKSFKALAEVQSVYNQGRHMPATGSMLLYFKKEGLTVRPAYGDVILVRNKVRALESPRNVGEFDYAAYMAHRQVYHSAWLEPGDWTAAGMNEASPAWDIIISYRQKLLEEVERLIRTDEEKGIARALLLGEDKELDPHLRATYAGTGTLHVLSVSGMHVGILFIILLFLFKPLLRTRTGRLVRLLTLLVLLWGYAMLTGMSPSVARAAAMFSLILVGLDFRRVTNTYNIIGASAFGLLLLDPYLLTQVSFQLSYAAILGIVWLQPLIARHWQPKGWVLKKGWEIVAASIAAQVTTFPLGVLYFGQFPVYFLLSNLIIIPISSVALIAGCTWLALASIPGIGILSLIPGYVTYALIDLMNGCAEFLAALPSATLEGLYIDKVDFIILSLVILLAALSLQYRRRSMLFSGAFCSVVFFFAVGYSRFAASAERRLTVHAVDKSAIISIKEGGRLFLLGDSSIYDADVLKYHFEGFLKRSYIARNDIIRASDTARAAVSGHSFYYRSPFGQFGDRKFIWLSDVQQLASLPQGVTADFVIVSRNLRAGVKDLAEKIRFGQLVITADNKTWRANRWESECREAGLTCTNLKKDYSFTIAE